MDVRCGENVADHIVIDALWRSTPTIIWHWVFQNIVLKNELADPSITGRDTQTNPFEIPPVFLKTPHDIFELVLVRWNPL